MPDPKSPPDVLTKDGWQREINRVLASAHKEAKPDDLSPQVYLYCTENPMTGEAYNPIGMFCFMSPPFGDPHGRDKQAFIHYVRLSSTAGGGVASIVVIEAWVAEMRQDDPDPTPPSQRLNRMEMLVAYSEHRDHGNMAYQATIKRGKRNKRIIEPWNMRPFTYTTIFDRMIPPASARTEQARLTAREVLRSNSMPLVVEAPKKTWN